MALTPKKRKFVEALLNGALQKDAAIFAGYSESSASQAGSRLAKDPDVIAHLERNKHKIKTVNSQKTDEENVNSEPEKVNKSTVKVNKSAQKVNKTPARVNKSSEKVNKSEPETSVQAAPVKAETVNVNSTGELTNLAADPVLVLQEIMNNVSEDPKLRLEAAKALMPYVHGKVAAQGKKEERQGRAKEAAKKFAPSAPPKLVVNNG